jgi:branched-chain amino acid transport system substrate-binding protein
MTNWRTGVIGLAAVAGLLAACGGSSSGGTGSAASGPPIELGSTNVLTGAIASVCKPITDGAKAWFDSVNAKGGVNGSQINFTVLDDAYDPARATTNARTLADKGVTALVAGCGTANETAAQTIAQQRQIPQIGPFANLPQFLSPAISTYYGLFPVYGAQDAASITFALMKFGAGSVVHITQNIPGVAQEDAAAQAATTAAGGQWLGSIFTDPKTTDYTPTALQVKAKNPDYVLFSGGSSQTAAIIKAFEQQNVSPNKMYLSATSSTDPVVLKAGGSALDGKFLGVSSVKILGSATQSCVDVINKYAPGSDTALHGLYGCSVAQIVTSALSKITGAVTSQSLAAALNGLNNDNSAPAFGPVTFSSNNHAGVVSGTAYEVSGGQFVESGTAPFIIP